MEQSDLAKEVGAAAWRAAPVAGGLGIVKTMGAWGPQEWSYVLIGAYAAMQIVYLAWKWHREWRTPKVSA
jgi:hypothetical protein